ncbi:hypothetical protein U0M67_002441 [Escherichia coli]|nr:hypothetical protein [Escherichia coli]
MAATHTLPLASPGMARICLYGEGNTNISGVTVVFRAGEQEQTPPEGFESSGSETVLGTEVKYDTPITRSGKPWGSSFLSVASLRMD